MTSSMYNTMCYFASVYEVCLRSIPHVLEVQFRPQISSITVMSFAGHSGSLLCREGAELDFEF